MTAETRVGNVARLRVRPVRDALGSSAAMVAPGRAMVPRRRFSSVVVVHVQEHKRSSGVSSSDHRSSVRSTS
jgi:hypothetical protein